MTSIQGGRHHEKPEFRPQADLPVRHRRLQRHALFLGRPGPGRSCSQWRCGLRAAAPDEGHGTGVIEAEETPPAHGKKGKFPWLVAAVVIVAGGAALYFLVLKKKNYTLTVSVGEGVTGSPAAGTSTSKKGTVINYSYAKQAGYDNLAVTLDGAPVAASGSVTMNANHALEARASKTFVLTVIKGDHVEGAPEQRQLHPRPRDQRRLQLRAGQRLRQPGGEAGQRAGGQFRDGRHERQPYADGAPEGGQHRGRLDARRGAHLHRWRRQRAHHPLHLHLWLGRDQDRAPAALLRLQGVQPDRQRRRRRRPRPSATSSSAGIQEDFEVPPSSVLAALPRRPAGTITGHGEYRYSGAALRWSTSVYNYSFTGDYTLIGQDEPQSRQRGQRPTRSSWARAPT